MLKYLWIGLVTSVSLWAGTLQFAPDLRLDTNRSVYLGLVNPTDQSLTASLAFYNEAGELQGSVDLTLGPYGKSEIPVKDLFADSSEGKPAVSIAWASVSSAGLPVGYVRYGASSPQWMTIAPLSRTSGAELWVPLIVEGLDQAPTLILNTSAVNGSATSSPNYQDDSVEQLSGQTLPDFGAAYALSELTYSELYAKPSALAWDHLQSADLHLTGLQYLRSAKSSDARGAAWVLPRTPTHRFVASPLVSSRQGHWNRLVLINTNQTSLRVDLTPHYTWYGTPPHDFTYQSEPFTLILEPGERHELDIDHPTQQNLPVAADWFEVECYNGGLLAYQLSGTKNGKAQTAIDIEGQPGSNRVLPYLVTNSQISTSITLTNTCEKEGSGRIQGYNPLGQMVGNICIERLRAYERRSYTLEELFGSHAAEVTWAMVRNSNGHLVTHAISMRRDGSALMGFSGVPTVATTDEALFAADMERYHISDMDKLGWQAVRYTDAGQVINNLSFESTHGDMVKPGEFWIEDAFNADSGFFYLGYEPYHSNNPFVEANGVTERVALVSPYIEIPLHGQWFLNYRMRFHNPQDAQWESRYGLIWREEGSDTWQFFGVGGRNLLEPDAALADCWVDIEWRNLIVTVTGWYPMEAPLPPETAGKRIQIGYYYDHQPKTAHDTSPWMFIDSIHIGAKHRPNTLFYELWGTGTLTPEDLAAVDDNFPLPPPVSN